MPHDELHEKIELASTLIGKASRGKWAVPDELHQTLIHVVDALTEAHKRIVAVELKITEPTKE